MHEFLWPWILQFDSTGLFYIDSKQQPSVIMPKYILCLNKMYKIKGTNTKIKIKARVGVWHVSLPVFCGDFLGRILRL